MRKISLDKLDLLFAEIAATQALYLPVDTKAGAKFERWEAGKTLSDAPVSYTHLDVYKRQA